eukprot:CAMPEP_0114532424 /NCGR_PEP_ID=MMETSP0109-20121206/26660_1 /TAXON_ID=29199 /ORGANISM="Chlorarachnion reptans, Strain CCCM449" /LENGTH=374 /DNA_ID=CAMNT_0001715491 /DNA_START=43 /DNA_END=1167 /DNA_ORIENTATION=+
MPLAAAFAAALAFAAMPAGRAVPLRLPSAGVGGFPDCAPGMKCFQLTPYAGRDLVFDCATAPANSSSPNSTGAGRVMFLHGNDGPRAKAMWALMMRAFAGRGYDTLACDQRGFSPGASPYSKGEYHYDSLAGDIFALADSYFGEGSRFHLVAHDQGARVGWHAAAPGVGRGGGQARSRYISYTPLSEAHSDAFSDALYGSDTDAKQQTNFMYLRQFTLPNESVLAYNENIWKHVCRDAYGYATPQACQPAVWWYSGAIAAGNLAVQPLAAFGPIGSLIGIPEEYVKEHTPYPLEGLPQSTRVGEVTEYPVLYVCGAGDIADLCNDRFRDETARRVANFSYLQVESCGHNLVSPQKCSEYQNVIDEIVSFVEAAS